MTRRKALQKDRHDDMELPAQSVPQARGGPPLQQGQMLNQDGLWQLITQGSTPFDIEELLHRFRSCTSSEQEDDQTLLSLEVL